MGRPRKKRAIGRHLVIGLVIAAPLLAGCATKGVQTGRPYSETGKASYYAHKFHGRQTASGEIYDENKMTAAHRELPFGTVVRVTNMVNNRSVVVTINDRGPFVRGRIIDLSLRAARELDFIDEGVVKVQVDVIDWD